MLGAPRVSPWSDVHRPALGNHGRVSTRWGTRSRRGAGIIAALLVGVLVGGCAPDEPFERLVDDRDASVDAVVAAEAFATMLAELETDVGVDPAPGGMPDARATVAAMSDAPMSLGNQARAFFEGHASQVARDTRTSGLSSVDVTVVSVTEADDADGTIALVTVDTVRTPPDGPASTVRSAYALSWDDAPGATATQTAPPTSADQETVGPPEPGTSAGTKTPQDPDGSGGPDGRPRLEQVRALHDDHGHHALVDAEADTSVLGVASRYVQALRSETDHEVDALEGGVRSSADLREALRTRLEASGRMTPVEVPCGRTGDIQIVYVVLDGDVPPLRLEVDVSGEHPVVNAYL